jgi:hypothetical protein
MKNLFVLTVFIILFIQGFSLPQISNDNLYWENLDWEMKQKVLNNKSLPSAVLCFYKENIRLTDRHKIIELLDTLTADFNNRNKEFRALYFHVFNQICLRADGVLSEAFGHYCLTIVMKSPEYVINYLCKHNDLMVKYTSLLGYEFYFKELGTSMLKYDYKAFKESIKSDCFNINCLERFFQEVERFMKAMD